MVHNSLPVGQSPVTKSSPNFELYEYLYNEPLPDGTIVPLADVSERDSVWDIHRVQAQVVELMYNYEEVFQRYAERVHECSGWLKFGRNDINGLVLKQAFFCRVRYCPVCQWRKSLYWKAIMYQNYEVLREQYPTHRFIFLTLTIKNTPIIELRQTLDHMNKSWKRLMNRKEFSAVVDGWIRTTEVTRDNKNPHTHAHPHFHCILMVKPSYFGKGYLKHAEWANLWQSCLKVDYTPVVDVRAVKAKDGDNYAIQSAIAETLKYSTKPSDIIEDYNNPLSRKWFYELTKQTHKLRFVATGGALKNILKGEDEIDNQDMITVNADEEKLQTSDERRWFFSYNRPRGQYIYNPKYNE